MCIADTYAYYLTNWNTLNLGGNFEIFNCLRLFVSFFRKKVQNAYN